MAQETNTIEVDRRAALPAGAAANERPKGRSLKSLAMLWPYARQHKLTVTAAAVFLLLGTVISLTIPLLFGGAVDAGFSGDVDTDGMIAAINRNFLLVFVAAVALGGVSALRFYFVSRFGERIAADLRRDVYGHMLALSPRYHSNMRSGEAVSRLTADISLIENFLGSSASLATRTLLNTTGALIAMLVVNWRLGLALLVIIPLAIVPIMIVGRVIRGLSTQAQSALAEAGAEAAETLDAIELVQAYGQSDARRGRFTHAVEETFRAALKRNQVRAWMMLLVSILAFGGITVVLWLGARAVAMDAMSGGDLTAMVLYALYAGSGFGMLGEVYGEVMRAAGAADRAADVLKAKPDITSPASPQLIAEPVTGALSFNNVTFAYDSNEGAALRNFSLDVAPGEFVALVGPSGAGKSTVFRLALRLFDPEAGTIRLDGVSSRAAELNAWRGQFAYAPQESALFTGTARENIAFGAPDADEEALMAAADMAEAWAFLEARDGLEAQLGQKGRGLSGGQRQRVALARALARNAPVLLLDEATSALDSENEAAVKRAISKAAQGRTTLVIAHRLSTVRMADRIIVMDEGAVVEEGTHDQLVTQGGLYARLAQLQFTETA
ncbi:MAG: ABC transporter transmembrane domain-containing protein [Pseudomonadota bacterium]|nr:ABC transporter transmembrane domain-containing protein [Pseudomonadota bacterium]